MSTSYASPGIWQVEQYTDHGWQPVTSFDSIDAATEYMDLHPLEMWRVVLCRTTR